jgi:succinate-semialdehyde dehydrogenase/glutarate-semialdehyde dehydrogenase
MIVSTNLATSEKVKEYRELSSAELDQRLIRAKNAYESWRETSFKQRAKHLSAAAEVLRDRVDVFAKLMTTEMGKPIAQSRSEVEKCAWVFDYYAENGAAFLQD